MTFYELTWCGPCPGCNSVPVILIPDNFSFGDGARPGQTWGRGNILIMPALHCSGDLSLPSPPPESTWQQTALQPACCPVLEVVEVVRCTGGGGGGVLYWRWWRCPGFQVCKCRPGNCSQRPAAAASPTSQPVLPAPVLSCPVLSTLPATFQQYNYQYQPTGEQSTVGGSLWPV